MPVMMQVKSNRKEWLRQAIAVSKMFRARDIVRNASIVLKQRFFVLERKAFESEGGTTRGGRWQELSPRYRARKAKTHPGKTILRREDRLFRSLTSDTENMSFGSATSFGFSYRFGTAIDEIYPEAHQKGLGRMPQRKFLDITEQQGRGIVAAIARTVSEGLFARAWFDRRPKLLDLRNTGLDQIQMS